MNPKEIKYKPHYDDVRGDFTAATRHRTSNNKLNVKKDCLWKQRTHKVTKIGDSVCLSLLICNTVVCEAEYDPTPTPQSPRLKLYPIFIRSCLE